MKMSPTAKRPATFFCRLEFIEVKGSLGSGEEFADNFFVTNDVPTIEDLLGWHHLEAVGTLEFHHFRKSRIVAYRRIPFIETGSERRELINSLLALNDFETAFWLHSDCCVG